MRVFFTGLLATLSVTSVELLMIRSGGGAWLREEATEKLTCAWPNGMGTVGRRGGPKDSDISTRVAAGPTKGVEETAVLETPK